MPVMPSKSVLLVEDDELLRECLCEMLSDVGLQVTEAADAVEALGRMNIDGVPGVLVTGMMLGPGMSGRALIAAARLQWPELHTVLMNGKDAAKLTIRSGNRFLGKPFNMDALIQAVTEGVKSALELRSA